MCIGTRLSEFLLCYRLVTHIIFPAESRERCRIKGEKEKCVVRLHILILWDKDM